jgi:hypothetical protein
MEISLNDAEEKWTDRFSAIIETKPKSLKLIIDSLSCTGNIEVFSQPNTSFTSSEKAWIKQIKKHLGQFPESPEFWLLSNIDGWSVGKGKPSFYSGTTVGTGGATGSLSDDFRKYYHVSFECERDEIGENFRDQCETVELKSNLGDLHIQNIREI